MTELLVTNTISIDRPKGSLHPRKSREIFPFDYGYLDNTSASDSGGSDV